MKVYLNEWSLESTNGVYDNMDAIKAFDKLVGELIQKCALEIFAPVNLWQLPLAGCNLTTSATTHPNDNSLPTEVIRYLRTIYSKMYPRTDGFPLFSEKQNMSVPSSSVGKASEEVMPVVSFTFNGYYAKDSIEGWYQKEGKDPVEGRVTNIYEQKAENYRCLADLTEGRHKNPLTSPLWNTELVGALLDGVDFVNVDNKVRQSMLITYGEKVAEMNGWRYDERVSKLNQNPGQLRYIFSSDNFVDYAPAYLSLDMEGPHLGFELCDKRGNHQGEYSWNGNHKDPKGHHGIRVK